MIAIIHSEPDIVLWEDLRTDKIVSYQNTEELIEKVESHSFRVLKKIVWICHQKVYQRHIVPMTKAQEKLYVQMKKNFVTELRGDTLTAPEAITRLLRLQQIICGWFPSAKIS